jgi:hypothetical protein
MLSTMIQQNSTKRTVISLTIAFSLSLIAWSIQNSISEKDQTKPMEAKVYPQKKQLLAD